MAKRLTIVFILFMGLVVLDFLFNVGTNALYAYGGSIAPPSLSMSTVADPGPGPSGGGAHGGLAVVDFSGFGKNGVGWRYLTQGYGRTSFSYAYIGYWHNGIDIGARYGADIYSASNGTVLAIGDQDNFCPRRAFGKFVIVHDGANNVDVLYAHLGTITVSAGQTVSRDNSTIGTVGSTGFETGPHLHFSVFQGNGFSMDPAHGCGPYPTGRDINPIPYLESL